MHRPQRAQRYFCPGRVNLIGEHIDYNGGLVMPAAISLGISATIESNGTDVIHLSSDEAPDEVGISVHGAESRPGHWSNHVLGVLQELRRNGLEMHGCSVRLSSTLPQGSGLSSSAAIEVLSYYMLTHFLTGKEPDRRAMALACQRVEHDHIGVKCGIMDQYAVALGKKDHALLLDCAIVEHAEIPLMLGEHVLLIIDSKAPRELATSAYNQRRGECEAALHIIRQKTDIEHLVEATMEEVEMLEDAILRKRARHVVSEQHRVANAAIALRRNDLVTFGGLLNASHASLRYDYEVSSPQLDHIVAAAQDHEGCVGARLTGAGFGGCCIALVSRDSIGDLSASLTETYRQRFNLQLDIHVTEICDGVRPLTL
jgi:galactokinase